MKGASDSGACRSFAPDFCIRLSEHLAKEAGNLEENKKPARAHTISQFVDRCFPPNFLLNFYHKRAQRKIDETTSTLENSIASLYVVQNSIHPKIYQNFMYDSALLPQQNTFVGLSINCFCLYSFLIVS